ncbi:putative ubiquitinyl hydrolase 1 [Helianthus annuus]|nr:putative ubiquitinyl hydrolase 1 [Helianthus annuus]KAJ0531430.1 putative ubiquitinyl hydrolase 1 [Helianthus annuus]KAJ0698273.1 putative ubiquitinyl hydrolase 1 [Helianthus annuus]
MTESMSLNTNITIVTQTPIHHENPGGELTECSRRIEFHVARKPPLTNGGDDGSFRLETLNPTTTSSKNTHQNNQSVGSDRVGSSGKKRDASELENGLDQELSFGITFRRIGAGLENLGNTCFLNSVLQCLTYTEPLAAYLQSGKHQVTCRKSGFCALCAIQKHVSRALQLSGRSLAPKDLVSNLRCISRTFRNSRQEDAHEYMVNLLESMHKCCLPNGVPIESQSAYDKSLVHKIFGGQLRSQVKCMQCNYCSNKFDPFLDLSLEILKVDTLYKAFANFTAKEQLDGGAKIYQCQQCKQKVKALKQLTVYKAPNVLTVHLKRFGCHMSGQKIDKKVHFGPTLDLKPFVTGPYDGDLKYTLYGVLVHAGWSTHSGHYYCFVRTSSGMWYSLDDNRVYQVSEKKVFEQKAYMLFYFKDRKNYPSKKTRDVHHKEKIVINGAPNGPGASREAQTKTGLSIPSLNAQRSLKKTPDVAQQKENIVMNGTPNGPGAPREVQMKTGLSNPSLNAQMSSKRTADVAQQKENIVMNGTPNGPGAPREAQMKTGLVNPLLNAQTSLKKSADVAQPKENIVMNGAPNGPGAPREAQTNTILTNGSLNEQKSLVSVNTPDCSGAPKEAQMKTGPSDGSLNAQKSLAAVGNEGNGCGPVAPIETQTNSGLSNDSLHDRKISAVTGTVINGFSAGASEPEQTQTNGTSVPNSISEPSKTEDRKKESSMENKAIEGKPRKKAKNFLKCKLISMKFSSNIRLGTSLNQRKKKKHKRNKRVKNLAQENLVKEGPSSSVKIEAQVTVKPLVDHEFKSRVVEDGAVLATSDFKSQSNPKESNQLESCRRSLSQKDFVHMLTRGIDERTVPRWDEDESASFHLYREERPDFAIGYIGDIWDEEYDRGKTKKVKISKTEFDGKNPFQDIANERLKSHTEKQNVSRRKNKHFKKSRSCNGPYRI